MKYNMKQALCFCCYKGNNDKDAIIYKNKGGVQVSRNSGSSASEVYEMSTIPNGISPRMRTQSNSSTFSAKSFYSAKSTLTNDGDFYSVCSGDSVETFKNSNLNIK
uniref:Uncharacterized protein n=1 Tax=Photinus pyralis TaxID=7054 RepID=A0A1Y1NHA6_PHOPY